MCELCIERFVSLSFAVTLSATRGLPLIHGLTAVWGAQKSAVYPKLHVLTNQTTLGNAMISLTWYCESSTVGFRPIFLSSCSTICHMQTIIPEQMHIFTVCQNEPLGLFSLCLYINYLPPLRSNRHPSIHRHTHSYTYNPHWSLFCLNSFHSSKTGQGPPL